MWRVRKKGRREVNQWEETEQGATGAERGQDKGGTGKGRKKGARQEEGGRERKREQEKGAGQKGEKQGREGATGVGGGAELLLQLFLGPRLGSSPLLCIGVRAHSIHTNTRVHAAKYICTDTHPFGQSFQNLHCWGGGVATVTGAGTPPYGY